MSGDSNRVHSKSGYSPLTNVNITNFRTYARKLGEEFSQMDYHYFILQLLYLVEYADYDSQAKLGLGFTNSSNKVPTNSGGCDYLGMKSGSKTTDGKSSVIYRGVEDIFGNIWQFVDGINIKDRKVYICYDNSKYANATFTGCYQPIGYTNASTDGYVSKLGYDPNHPLISFPIEVNESSNTHITDYYYQLGENRISIVGGGYNDTTNAGMWFWYLRFLSHDYTSVSASRLLKN